MKAWFYLTMQYHRVGKLRLVYGWCYFMDHTYSFVISTINHCCGYDNQEYIIKKYQTSAKIIAYSIEHPYIGRTKALPYQQHLISNHSWNTLSVGIYLHGIPVFLYWPSDDWFFTGGSCDAPFWSPLVVVTDPYHQ